MQNKVFIIQDDGKRDFSQAEKFGKLVPILAGDVFPDNKEERVATINTIIDRKLNDFYPLYDYVLLTGDPIAMVAIGMQLQANFPNQVLKFLKYDREARDYFVVNM